MVRRRPFRLQPLITFIAALLLVWLLLKTDLKGIPAAAGQIPVGLLLTLAGMQTLPNCC